MLQRYWSVLLLGALLAIPLAGCTSSQVDSVTVSPTTQSVAVGQTAQFTATATTGHGNHPSSSSNVTDAATWTSSEPSVATINSSGLAKGVSAGTATITATVQGFTGQITSSATITVTGAGGTGGVGNADFTSISIIPGAQSVASPGETGQFIAIGATSAGATANLTNQVSWTSSSSQIATINSAGLATGISQGTASITAIYTNPGDGSLATGTATFQVVNGTSEQVSALQVFPTSQGATALAQLSQFTALGTENGLQYDVTGQVAWTSTDTAVATVGTAGNGTPGLVTAIGAGSATIEATYTNKDSSKVVATAAYSVTAGTAPEPLLSISVVPGGTTVSNEGMTGQYLAFGTFSTPPLTRDITSEVTWISLLPEIASIGSGGTPGELAGLATAEGYTGATVIYAEDTKSNPDGTVVVSNAQTFTCADPLTSICEPEVAVPQFSTVTVYVAGENTFVPNMAQIGPDALPYAEYVTAPSDTGSPNLIHCDSSASSPQGSTGAKSQWAEVGGTGGVVCTGTYEVGTTLTLTENLPPGNKFFGGWSSGAAETLECTIQTGNVTSNTCGFSDPNNPPAGWSCTTVTTGTGSNASSVSTCYDPIPCTPASGYTNANSPTCTLPLLGNATVGVIFY
ncbi:MAG TPA: Ig-like domain-containing protein [Terracidiphilus sp.]|nr:Ig-like domain-containing protein [Terracidiphilus sp.]